MSPCSLVIAVLNAFVLAIVFATPTALLLVFAASLQAAIFTIIGITGASLATCFAASLTTSLTTSFAASFAARGA